MSISQEILGQALVETPAVNPTELAFDHQRGWQNAKTEQRSAANMRRLATLILMAYARAAYRKDATTVFVYDGFIGEVLDHPSLLS